MTLCQLTRLPPNVAGRQRVVDSDICWIFGIFLSYFAELQALAKQSRELSILIKYSESSFFRRQTAEEREQERQAATKYFLSMQIQGSMAAAAAAGLAINTQL